MTRRKVICSVMFLSAAVALFGHGALSPDLLKKLIPEAQSFVTRQKTLSPQAIAKVEQASESKVESAEKNLSVVVGVAKDAQTGKPRSVGAVLMVDARGAAGAIDLAIGYALDGTVKKVIVTQNGDDKALESPAFLKQLEGKKPSDNWDPKNFSVSANPASTRAVIQAVRRGMHLVLAFAS